MRLEEGDVVATLQSLIEEKKRMSGDG